jgi:serine protease Do
MERIGILLPESKTKRMGKIQYLITYSTIFLCIVMYGFSLPSPVLAAEKMANVDLSTAIISVAKQAIPAVVHIEVTEQQEVANPFLPFENDPSFRQFFGSPKMPKNLKRELKGLGSGMIIDTQGHILTNHHVAGGATKIDVLLSDGHRYPAKLVGTDPKTDLAVIQIASKEALPHVTLGDSDKVEVGEWVVAIGHPRGLDQTVTQGIISAKHRRGITDPGSYQDFLQTDAAINPGNSGGPLLNLQGEVIGVNAAIASESGGSEGIGFAIPSNIAIFVSKALIAHGKVERGWLGVSIQDLTPETAKTARVESLNGALIAEVVKGGPAEKAGLRKNDVVVGYQGKEVSDSGTFRNDVATTPIGSEARVTILREGKKQELMVKIANSDEAAKFLAGNVKERLGAEVRSLTPQEIGKYGLKADAGVAIRWLEFKGPLQKAGFEINDIILGINDQPVEGLDNFVQLVSSLKPHQKIAFVALDYRTGNQGVIQVETK